MSQRSPQPCRYGGTAPYPRRTDPGARRQILCDMTATEQVHVHPDRDHQSVITQYETGSVSSRPASKRGLDTAETTAVGNSGRGQPDDIFGDIGPDASGIDAKIAASQPRRRAHVDAATRASRGDSNCDVVGEPVPAAPVARFDP